MARAVTSPSGSNYVCISKIDGISPFASAASALSELLNGVSSYTVMAMIRCISLESAETNNTFFRIRVGNQNALQLSIPINTGSRRLRAILRSRQSDSASTLSSSTMTLPTADEWFIAGCSIQFNPTVLRFFANGEMQEITTGMSFGVSNYEHTTVTGSTYTALDGLMGTSSGSFQCEYGAMWTGMFTLADHLELVARANPMRVRADRLRLNLRLVGSTPERCPVSGLYGVGSSTVVPAPPLF